MTDRKRQRPRIKNTGWEGKIREPFMGNEVPLHVRVFVNSFGLVVGVQVTNTEGITENFRKEEEYESPA